MPALSVPSRRSSVIARMLPPVAPSISAPHRPGQLSLVLALVGRACAEDLPRVEDPQFPLPFGAAGHLRAPREEEVSLHAGFDADTGRALTVVIGPCKTAAVYLDEHLVGLADAAHPRFVAHLAARRFPSPLPAEYRLGQAAPALQLVHRT